jgi:1,2-diacylglycerol-3-alpha-glucose alpha-1,2-galactosyltransferase
MKIHVISESQFVMQGTGIHTAFLDHVKLLKEQEDIEVVVNGEGTGDIFHSHTYFLYYFWKGRKYKGRRVFTAHVIPESIKGSLPLWRLFMPFVSWGLKKVYKYADVCIAPSPMVEKVLRDICPEIKVVKIFNFVNAEIWKRTEDMRIKGRKLLELSDNDFVVLGVGQLQQRKGVDDFLDIADAIPEARFVWAGGRPFGILSEGMVRINERFRKAGSHVTLAGQVELNLMPFIYAASDMMIFTSHQETFGLAPLEAAASGIPVIFRDIPVYELLYENPYLKADSNDQFISMTRMMMKDKQYYDDGLTVSRQLIKQFDRNEIRGKYLSVYKSLINNELK